MLRKKISFVCEVAGQLSGLIRLDIILKTKLFLIGSNASFSETTSQLNYFSPRKIMISPKHDDEVNKYKST